MSISLKATPFNFEALHKHYLARPGDAKGLAQKIYTIAMMILLFPLTIFRLIAGSSYKFRTQKNGDPFSGNGSCLYNKKLFEEKLKKQDAEAQRLFEQKVDAKLKRTPFKDLLAAYDKAIPNASTKFGEQLRVERDWASRLTSTPDSRLEDTSLNELRSRTYEEAKQYWETTEDRTLQRAVKRVHFDSNALDQKLVDHLGDRDRSTIEAIVDHMVQDLESGADVEEVKAVVATAGCFDLTDVKEQLEQNCTAPSIKALAKIVDDKGEREKAEGVAKLLENAKIAPHLQGISYKEIPNALKGIIPQLTESTDKVDAAEILANWGEGDDRGAILRQAACEVQLPGALFVLSLEHKLNLSPEVKTLMIYLQKDDVLVAAKAANIETLGALLAHNSEAVAELVKGLEDHAQFDNLAQNVDPIDLLNAKLQLEKKGSPASLIALAKLTKDSAIANALKPILPELINTEEKLRAAECIVNFGDGDDRANILHQAALDVKLSEMIGDTPAPACFLELEEQLRHSVSVKNQIGALKNRQFLKTVREEGIETLKALLAYNGDNQTINAFLPTFKV